MAPEGIAAVLWAPNQLSHFFPTSFVFSLMSPTQRLYCFPGTRPKSPSFVWRKYVNTEGITRGSLLEFVGEWVTRLYRLFYWPMWNHGRINWMRSVRDYPTNGTLKTIISYVSSSRGGTTTLIIYSWLGFPCISRTEQLCLVRWGVGLCVYLSITARAQFLILRKSWGTPICIPPQQIHR